MLDPHHYVEALNLFGLLDRPEMVPAAVYRCCQLGPGALLEGVQREDGSEALERLSPEDLELCMETVPRLMRATVRVMMGLTDLVEARMSLVCAQQPDCVMPKTCVGGLAAMLGEWRDHMAYRVDTDALGTDFSEDVDTRVCRGAMCRVCGDVLRAAHRRFRREVWAALPRLTETDVKGWNSG
ncbi:hypothetical protein GSI_09542 [Ganoderma sinense ZZ0214-1]|uniref:Uncharacterized protein n=1 Tax=Ganoderma sinense ZZ0214-1 TaxID=1077348 RepID=A0A2G8S3Q3_9APHY|nr:hypothetical protein GSI_09542 [Ganoderma sinense ZZ0214-1]